MLAYSTKKWNSTIIISCSDGRTHTAEQWEDISWFLLMPTDMAVVWNIDEFVDILASSMSADLSKKLMAGGRLYTPDNRKLFYAASRVWSINQVSFYGLSRYSDTRIDDVNELAELGKRVVKAYETFGVQVTKLSSPIAVYSEVLDSLDFPRACDLPDEAFPLIEQCTRVMTREWRDVYQLGHWNKDEITDYDLTAAYPSIVANLPDISKAEFFTTKTMPDKYTWGELYGRLKIVKPVSSFFYQHKNCYPMGEWEDSITTDQLWLLKRYGIGEFNMKYGNFFILPSYKRSYPFKDIMTQLYQQRQSKDILVSKIAKGISVGIWGKFAEIHEHNKLGDFFNSIYARMTTSRCMVKLADFIYRNHLENDVVSVLVDDVLTTKRLPISTAKMMGQWRMNEPKPALVLSLLYQWQGDKKPANLVYSEIIDLIKQKPDSTYYKDVDLNLLNYSRQFLELPRTGGELLSKHYTSTPIEIGG